MNHMSGIEIQKEALYLFAAARGVDTRTDEAETELKTKINELFNINLVNASVRSPFSVKKLECRNH